MLNLLVWHGYCYILYRNQNKYIMKKIIIIVFLLVSSIISFGQVTYNKPKEPTFEWLQSICHTFATDAYDLYINSDNQFEDYEIVVKLGKGKDQALQSLLTIKKMFDDAKEGYTFNLGGYKFTKILGNAVTSVNGKAGMYEFTKSEIERWIRLFRPIEEEYDIKGIVSLDGRTIEITDYIYTETTEDILDKESIPYQLVEVKPFFDGGINEFATWVDRHIQNPNRERGRVTAQFTIDEEGNLINPKILRGVNKELDNEAIRVLKLSPKWHPGKQNGENVPVTYTFPIVF